MVDPIVAAEINHNTVSRADENRYSAMEHDAVVVDKFADIIELFEKDIRLGITKEVFNTRKERRVKKLCKLAWDINHSGIRLMIENYIVDISRKDMDLDELIEPDYSSESLRKLSNSIMEGEYDYD